MLKCNPLLCNGPKCHLVPSALLLVSCDVTGTLSCTRIWNHAAPGLLVRSVNDRARTQSKVIVAGRYIVFREEAQKHLRPMVQHAIVAGACHQRKATVCSQRYSSWPVQLLDPSTMAPLT